MKFKSTRGFEQELSGAQAIIQGIAPDKGLYVPTEIPKLPCSIHELCSMNYLGIANAVIGTFFDDYTPEEMEDCVANAYTNTFGEPNIAPIRQAGDAWFLELYHGRTAAFKDMALSILPYLLTTAMKKENVTKKICILTATSGDTGKAALEGFADVPGTEIVVFFPESGVSEIQKKQMVSQTGKNVHVFAIHGNFDDAQTGVKNIFNDDDFAQALDAQDIRLSSANSINIGRLVPQIAYYVYAYTRLVNRDVIKPGELINVCVPTGNFGNILAAYYAQQMGLPISKLICASNRNNVLTDFLTTGTYDTQREFYQTNSPSMDILVSSNLERLLYTLSGNDAEEVRTLMQSLDQNKHYEVSDTIKDQLHDFAAGFATEEETEETIGKMFAENNYLLDTHTAVAYKVYEDYRKKTGDTLPTVIASTASAYKFAASVGRALGLEEEANGFRNIEAVSRKTHVRVPGAMKGLEDKPVLHDQVIEVADMKDAVKDALVK